MKIFKKLITSILCFVILFSSCFFLVGCGNREEVLRLYVPGEYIPDEVLTGFEEWYLEQTGKPITVQKKEFDSNETMYTMVAVKRQDFDVICPSDYMIERLINEKLLLTIDDETSSVIKNAVLGEENSDGTYPNETFASLINNFDPNFSYTAPYMWGTMGILYYFDEVDKDDPDFETAVKQADIDKSAWTTLFNIDEQKIYMKNSERDSYTVALFNHYYDELLGYLGVDPIKRDFTDADYDNPKYQALLKSIFTTGDNITEKIGYAEETLKNQKKIVYDYETDEGKDDLLTSKGAEGYYGAFWSCDAGYIMADWSTGDVVYNENFRYIVPNEGSNVWVDGFCIPKYAGNKTGAQMFMQYMADPDVAFDCMDYAGCTSAVYQTTLDYEEYLKTEDDVFAETSEAFQAMYLSLLLPHLDIQIGNFKFESPLKRCGIMRDLGSKASDELLIMWSILRRY